MKKIYMITRKETMSEYCFIEAENEETAREIAEDLDSELWRSCQDYECDITEIEEAEECALKGKYIETETGSYIYK